MADGPYHITATLAPASALGNYNVTKAGADFSIIKRNATWTTNPNSSGGAFTNATSPGGTLDIRYNGNTAIMTFNGLIDTTGTTNVLLTPAKVSV